MSDDMTEMYIICLIVISVATLQTFEAINVSAIYYDVFI